MAQKELSYQYFLEESDDRRFIVSCSALGMIAANYFLDFQISLLTFGNRPLAPGTHQETGFDIRLSIAKTILM